MSNKFFTDSFDSNAQVLLQDSQLNSMRFSVMFVIGVN